MDGNDRDRDASPDLSKYPETKVDIKAIIIAANVKSKREKMVFPFLGLLQKSKSAELKR